MGCSLICSGLKVFVFRTEYYIRWGTTSICICGKQCDLWWATYPICLCGQQCDLRWATNPICICGEQCNLWRATYPICIRGQQCDLQWATHPICICWDQFIYWGVCPGGRGGSLFDRNSDSRCWDIDTYTDQGSSQQPSRNASKGSNPPSFLAASSRYAN